MADNPYLTSLLGGKKPATSSTLDDETEARLQKYSEMHGVDPDLARRLIRQESGGKNHSTSWAGARGLMQLGPDTVKRFGVKDPFDPDQNLDAGMRYLREHLDEFGEPAKALAAYNAGEGAVRKHGYDKVRRFSNLPKGDKRRGGYAGSTGEYVDRILGDYSGTGYHPNLKRDAIDDNPYFRALTAGGNTADGNTRSEEVQASGLLDNSNDSNDSNRQTILPPPVNLELEKTTNLGSPGEHVKLPEGLVQPGAPASAGDGSQNSQSANFRIPVKEGMQSIDVLREALTQKARAAGLVDKSAKSFANEALAEAVRAGKNPGLHGPDGRSPLDAAGLENLLAHGYADVSIADPIYDQLLQKHVEEQTTVDAEKKFKQYNQAQAENQTLADYLKSDKKGKEHDREVSDRIAHDLQWHFGINDPNDFNRMPAAKQRKILLLTAEAVGNDEKKKQQGANVRLSLEYQNLMRQRVGLGPNPSLIEAGGPPRATGKFSIDKNFEQLLNLRPDESYAPGYNAETGKVEVRPPAPPRDFGPNSPLYAEMRAKVISEQGGESNVARIKSDYAIVGRDPSIIDQKIEQQTQAKLADFQQREQRVLLAESGRAPKLTVLDKIRELGDQPSQLIPFISSAADITHLLRVGSAAQKLENLDRQQRGVMHYREGGLPTEEDLLLLREFQSQQKADSTFGYKVANTLSALPAFVGEFALSGGIYSAAKQGAVKGLEKLVTKEGMQTLERNLAGRLATKVTTGLVGAAAQTIPSGLTRIPAGVLYREQHGDDFVEALAQATGDQFIEIASERAGGLLELIPLPKRLSAIRDAITARWLSKTPQRSLAQLQEIVKRTGWHGVLGEMFEERVGDIAHYALGQQDSPIPTLEQLAVEGVAFSVPGALNTVAGYALGEESVPQNVQSKASIEEALPDSAQDLVQNLPTEEKPNALPQIQSDAPATDVPMPTMGTTAQQSPESPEISRLRARANELEQEDLTLLRQWGELPEDSAQAQALHDRRWNELLPEKDDVDARLYFAEGGRYLSPDERAPLLSDGWDRLPRDEQRAIFQSEYADRNPEVRRLDEEKAEVPGPSTPETQAEPQTSEQPPRGVIESVDEDAATVEKNKPGTKHEFSSTQVNLPADVAGQVKRLALKIPDKDLGPDGREDNPHATVKFGLHTADAEDVQPIIENKPPIKVTIGKISTFPPSDSSGGSEVLKFDVDSKDLHRLNKKLSDSLPHTDTFKYSPHITLAYVKPGIAQRYVGKKHPLQGKTITIDKLTFSGKNGELIDIPLKGNADNLRIDRELQAIEARFNEEAQRLNRRLESGHLNDSEFQERLARIREILNTERDALIAQRARTTDNETGSTSDLTSVTTVVRETKRRSRRFDPETMDLTQAVRALGGIRVDRTGVNSGELARITPRELGTSGLVNNKSGTTAEQVAMTLAEEGYRGDWVTVGTSNDGKETLDVDPNKFLEALEADATGVSKTYSRQREVDWEAEFEKRYADDPDQRAVDSMLKDSRAAELLDLVESGRANEHERQEFREVAEQHGLSQLATDFFVRSFFERQAELASKNVQDPTESEAVGVEPQPAPSGTPLDPNYLYDDDGNILFHRPQQLGFVDDALTLDSADKSDTSRTPAPHYERFPHNIFGENADALTRLAQSPAPEVRYVAELLSRRAPHLAGAGADVDVGITNLAIALTKLDYLRRTGTPVNDYLNQGSLFGEQLDSMQITILEALDEHRRDHRAIARMVDTYLQQLKKGDAEFLPSHEPETATLFHRAFHGTAHGFEKFSTEHIGTGEGAQSYGWGLYFADAEEVARHYRAQNSERDFIRKVADSYSEFDSPDDAIDELLQNPELTEYEKNLLTALQADDWLGFDYPHQAVQAALREPDQLDMSEASRAALRSFGRMYEVELAPKQDEYLLWDKPLNEQSQKVREALERISYFGDARTGGEGYRKVAKDHGGSQEMASAILHEAGIRGIKYLDGASRKKGGGSYNYVIFDENDVKIEAQYKKAEGEERAEISPDDLAELLPQVQVVQQEHRLQLNAAAYRVMIEAVNAVQLKQNAFRGRRVGGFSGAFFNRTSTARIERALIKLANEHQAREQLQGGMRLANAFRRAAGHDGMVIVYRADADSKTLVHEGFHRASSRNAHEARLTERHARFDELLETPAFKKASPKLIKKGYDPRAPGPLVEEIAAYIWSGERDKVGLSEDEALDYLELWFTSYTEKNGDQSLEEFEHEREEAQRFIAANRDNKRRQDVESVSAKRSRRPEGTAQEDRRGEGQPLYKRDSSQVDTPEFKAFFRESKVVDKKGRPRVVYHRSDAKFTSFDKRKIDHFGFHFGSLKQARAVNIGRKRGHLYRAYLRIENPLRLPDLGSWDTDQIVEELRDRHLITDEQDYELDHAYDPEQRLREIIQSHGYDGIIYENRGERQVIGKKAELYEDELFERERYNDSYIAFEPTQIKSATHNRGTFDPDNPNMLFDFDESRSRDLRSRAFRSLVEAKQTTSAMPTKQTKPGAYVKQDASHKSAPKAAPVPAAPPAPPPPTTPSTIWTDEELLQEADRILADPQARSYLQRIAHFAKQLPRELQRTFTSEFTPLKVAEMQLRGGKQRLDLAAKAELLPGASGKAELDLVRFQTRVVSPIAKLHTDFNKFVLYKRIFDRLTHDGDRKRVASWTADKAEQALNALKKKVGDVNWKRLEKAGQAFQEEADLALQLRVEAGLISQKTYEAIKASTDFYAPFVVMKHVVEGIPTEGGGRRIPSTQDLIDRITGIKEEDFQLQDFVLSAAQQIYQTRVLAEKNLFMRDDFAPLADVDTKGELVRSVKLTRYYRVEFKPAEDILSQMAHQNQPIEQSFIKVGRAIQLAEAAGLTVKRKDMFGAQGRATLGGMESNGKVLLRAFTSEVIAHELGHAADVSQKDSAGKPLYKSRKVFGTRRDIMQRVSSDINSKRPFQKELARLVDFTKLGGDAKYRASAKERFAEFISLYIHNPKQARSLAPTWTDHFELNLLKVPEVKKLIEGLSTFFQKVDGLPNIKTRLKEMDQRSYLETAIMRAFPNRAPIIAVQTGERGLHDVAQPGYQIVKYLDEGSIKGLEVRTDLAKALEGLHRGEATIVSRVAMIAAQPFRLGATTLNLAFQPVNLFFADLPRAALMSRYGVRRVEDLVRFPADWIYSFFSSLFGNFGYRNKLYEDFMKSGAYNSTMQRELTPEAFKPAMGVGKSNIAKGVIGVPLKLSSVAEETSKTLGVLRGKRFENYDKLSPEQQAQKMREIASEVRRYSGSPDFWRKGIASTGRTLDNLNLWFMFINARIQGTAADLSRLAGLAGGARPATAAWLRMAIAVGLPTLALALFNLDDDELKLQGPEGEWKTTNRESYNAIPDWERRGNWMIPRDTYFMNDRGERVRNYWRLPKREIGQLFSNMIEAAVEFADKRESARLATFAVEFLENISPVGISGKTPIERMESIVSSMNPIVKAPIELVFNRDTFRHRNIIPDYIDKVKSSDLPAGEQYTRSTSEAFVKVGKAVGVSPLLLEHATRGFSAGLITQFLPPKPQPGRSPVLSYPVVGPVARRFVRSESTARQSDNEILDQAVKQGATNKVETNRAAYRLYQSWKKDPQGKELDEYLEERQVDPSIGKEVLALKEDDDNDLTSDERVIRQLGVENGDRARYLKTLLKDKKDQEREQMIEEWRKKGLASKSVIEQLEASDEELRELIQDNNEKRMNSRRRRLAREQ